MAIECQNLFQSYPLYNHRVGIAEVIYIVLFFFSAFITFYWIWKQRSSEDLLVSDPNNIQAFQPHGKRNYTIFPIFVPILIYSVASDILFGGVSLFFQASESDPNSISICVIYGTVFALQHFLVEGLAFALCQYGCGIGAAKNAAIRAFAWACITFLCIFLRYHQGATVLGYSMELSWQCCMCVYYYMIWLLPKQWLYRRPAVTYYAKFWAIFRTLSIFAACLYDFGTNNLMVSVGSCAQVVVFNFLYILLKPFVVYYTLLADTVWWQGQQARGPVQGIGQKLSQSASKILLYRCVRGGQGNQQQGNRNKRFGRQEDMHQDESSLSIAQELAHAVDNLHAKGSVKLLNSAYLKYNKKDKIGAGSFSNVFIGKYRSVPVAIKMLLTIDLTPEVIRRCGNEAQLLSRIQSRNVVCCLGVAVLPPSVCIVLEFCQFGSLSDVLRGMDAGGVQKQPLNLTAADRMFLALGCARGLEALHSFSSHLCHRDIKSMNFLVDAQLDVKIADLELGYNSRPEDGAGDENGDEDSLHSILSHTTLAEFYSSAMISPWQPPEIFRGEDYTQASDIYSLALVLWEIVAAPYLRNKQQRGGEKGTPFWEFSKDEIKEEVLAGRRPLLPPGQDPAVIDLITRGWSDTPSRRPDAEEFCKVLAKCWRAVVHRHICETPHVVDMVVVKAAHSIRVLERQRELNSRWKPAPRKAPSPDLLNSLIAMKQEHRWAKLEEQGAYLITSPEPPFIILWATKKWTQLTGFVLNDVLADDLSIISGPKTDSRMLNQALGLTFCGETAHIMVTFYRRDHLSQDISLHSYPIYDDKSDLVIPDPLSTFGPDLIPFTLSRSNSVDGSFYAASPQPKVLPTVIERAMKETSVPGNFGEDDENDELNHNEAEIASLEQAASVSNVAPSTAGDDSSVGVTIPPKQNPAIRAAMSPNPTACSSLASSYPYSSPSSNGRASFGHLVSNPMQKMRASPLVMSSSYNNSSAYMPPYSDDVESPANAAAPIIRGNSFRGSLERVSFGHSYSSNTSNNRNLSILSSLISGHDSAVALRSVANGTPGYEDATEPLLQGTDGLEGQTDGQLGSLLADLAGGLAGGPAYSGASTTRQLRADSITHQRLAQLMTMTQEDEIDARISYPSFRSSVASLPPSKRVAFVALLFSDVTEGK